MNAAVVFPGRAGKTSELMGCGRGRIGWPKGGVFTGFGFVPRQKPACSVLGWRLCVRSPCRGRKTFGFSLIKAEVATRDRVAFHFICRSGFAPAIARCGLPAPGVNTAKKIIFCLLSHPAP